LAEAKRGLSNHKTTPTALKSRQFKKKQLIGIEGLNRWVDQPGEGNEIEDYAMRIQTRRLLGDIAQSWIPTSIITKHPDRKTRGLKEIYGNDFAIK
jgi:glutamine synthetase